MGNGLHPSRRLGVGCQPQSELRNALFAQGRAHHPTMEELKNVDHARHPVRNHVLDRRPTRKRLALDFSV